MRDVHWCVTVDYQQIPNDNIANQNHGFTIDYGKLIVIISIVCKTVEIGHLPWSLFLSVIEAHNITTTVTDASFSYGNFHPIKPRKSRKKPPKTSDVWYESDEDDCDRMNKGDAKTSSPKLGTAKNYVQQEALA